MKYFAVGEANKPFLKLNSLTFLTRFQDHYHHPHSGAQELIFCVSCLFQCLLYCGVFWDVFSVSCSSTFLTFDFKVSMYFNDNCDGKSFGVHTTSMYYIRFIRHCISKTPQYTVPYTLQKTLCTKFQLTNIIWE